MVSIEKDLQENIKKTIRSIPDFPKKGILFRDITTLLLNGSLFKKVNDLFYEYCREKEAEAIAAIESRGFIFGGAVADRMEIPFVPIRKEGKLPHIKLNASYSLEYGEATVEIHKDALQKGQRVVIIDDLLATGGTAVATAELVEKCGGVVAGIALLVELSFLKGREKLNKYDIFCLACYDD